MRAQRLLDLLWNQYKKDCPYAQTVCDVFGEKNIVNDHIAFRSVNTGFDSNHGEGLLHGVDPIEAIWSNLGWSRAGTYNIESKNIWAIHMEPPKAGFPKIFISQFQSETLEQDKRLLIEKYMGKPREIITPPRGPNNMSAESLFEFFNTSLYPEFPDATELEALEGISQYVSWVRLFGRKVNHFTLLVNSLDLDIRGVYQRIERQVPMKDEIEGEGTELAQTSTKAANLDVAIFKNGTVVYEKRPYAYYEIAERGVTRFEGFKVEQTKGLFDMTKRG